MPESKTGIKFKVEKIEDPFGECCDAIEKEPDYSKIPFVDSCEEVPEYKVTELRDGKVWHLCKKHYEQYKKVPFIFR